jgi:hypothetical protein
MFTPLGRAGADTSSHFSRMFDSAVIFAGTSISWSVPLTLKTILNEPCIHSTVVPEKLIVPRNSLILYESIGGFYLSGGHFEKQLFSEFRKLPLVRRMDSGSYARQVGWIFGTPSTMI